MATFSPSRSPAQSPAARGSPKQGRSLAQDFSEGTRGDERNKKGGERFERPMKRRKGDDEQRLAVKLDMGELKRKAEVYPVP